MRYLLLTLLLFPMLAFAQETETSFKNNFKLGIVPQYAITNGTRIDLDFQLKNKNHWIVVAPQVYISNQGTLDWDYNSMFGAGIEIQHKIFLTDQSKKRSVYMAYGPTFNFFSVADYGLTAQEFAEDGGNYIGLTEDEITTNIFKLGGNLIFGLQYTISERFYIDPYIGTGIRFSFDDQTTGLHGYYNEWWADMGYSGTLMVGGIRIGVLF